MTITESPAAPAHVAVRARRRGLAAISVLAELVLTVGVVFLLLVVYEVWITDIFSAHEQAQLAQQLQRQWRAPSASAGSPEGAGDTVIPPVTPPPVGQPFAFLHIPRLGANYERAIVEGTDQPQLAGGPGHYVGTVMPGQLGNFAVAGHRVGTGSPFLDLDTLRPGDPIVVETADAWYVYRVLGTPASGSFAGDPSGIPGLEVVLPRDVRVIAPVPDAPAATRPTRAYLTLTTCNPKFSARTRLVIHAALDGAPIPKSAVPQGPAVLHTR